jgi:hypothetical protein
LTSCWEARKAFFSSGLSSCQSWRGGAASVEAGKTRGQLGAASRSFCIAWPFPLIKRSNLGPRLWHGVHR